MIDIDLNFDFELLKIPFGLLFIAAFTAALFLTVP
jgi:hypothetical protein